MTVISLVFRSEEDYGYVYDVYYTDGLGQSGVMLDWNSSINFFLF